MEKQEITLKAGEPVTLPSGEVITLLHTGKLTEGNTTRDTAIIVLKVQG